MYNFLNYHNLPVTIIATKVDKISKNDREKQINLLKEELEIKDGDNLVLFSSKTKLGKTEIQNEISKIVYGKEE